MRLHNVLCIVLASAITLVHPTLTDAALKPLTVQERLKYARHVFIGTVESVDYKDVDRAPQFPNWITRHYKCLVRLDRVIKTIKHSRPNPSHPADETVEGPLVHLMAWKGIGRPDGFVGDSGTATVPQTGSSYVFYTQFLHPDPQLRSTYHDTYPHVAEEDLKAYNALMPNGIDSVEDYAQYERDLGAHTEL